MALSRKVFPQSIRLFVVASAMTLSLTVPAVPQAAPATPAGSRAAAPALPLFLRSADSGKPNVYVLAMEFECADPAQEEAFNKWYNEVFIPRELAIPGYQAAWRMRVELPQKRWEKSPERPTYLTLFEIQTNDLTAVMRARLHRMRALAAEKGPASLLNEVNGIPYRTMIPIVTRANTPYGRFAAKAKHPAKEVDPTRNLKRYAISVDSNATDPAKEEVFNTWYDKIHIPDVLTSPGYQVAWRLEILEPRMGRGRYMTFYEIHTDNLRVAMDTRDERRVREYMVGAYEGSYTSGVSQSNYVVMGEKLTKK
ncbi:MAG: hypothetical protein KME17_18985 [Cyanosarcina radialis HA8281-LM2]|jgi:hypothetical protein|nr:hypothetical protein [Cyanosarcina radialis HA8281-LM2]